MKRLVYCAHSWAVDREREYTSLGQLSHITVTIILLLIDTLSQARLSHDNTIFTVHKSQLCDLD